VTLGADIYPYKVLPDESWTVVSGRTGVPIAALQAANPQAIRDNEWLLTNEVLQIPVLPQPDWLRSSVVIHAVQPGESWYSIAADFQISHTLLWAVNWHLRRPWGVLITGDEMIVPPAPVQ
jgi:LysM repeat protein